ncbi:MULTISPECIES: ABC transporter ATP-binding protein [unclassified Janthinobacterium]|uniref:ABC transporter ATP-binding protein n=1 Tax=unclassified Janthinobacterium TaxID=2610881 RepID=UPI00087F1A80|nr:MULTISPECIES: ATP-binding cassette domain-containing protein [unclassified Janthinobacterium]SDA56886.1 putative ABC transport system ATP-binding protein [Janthinobacterium sp. 551a]SFB27014.1 putative ABC transport system ATP-binding protein [Janthinobacterium sp. 344]
MLHLASLTYGYGDTAAEAVLDIAAFHLPAGRHALLLGPSGSGKSTLLHLLAGILAPQAGRLEVAGTSLPALTPRQRDSWRGRTVGLLPQQLALVASLSVLENVLLPAYASGQRADPARAASLLDQLGLGDKLAACPHELSGGQRQRAAIARAVVMRPQLILADEPTANLDDAACAAVIALLASQAALAGATLIIASHDARVLAALPQAKVLRLPQMRAAA